MLRFRGRTFRDGDWWPVEVPVLGVYTQGYTERDAYAMIADAIEMLVDRPGYKVQVFPGSDGHFELGSDDPAPLIAMMLRTRRQELRLKLMDVSRKLGSDSPNTYARYEQGKCVPTLTMLVRLMDSLGEGGGLVIDVPRANRAPLTSADFDTALPRA